MADGARTAAARSPLGPALAALVTLLGACDGGDDVPAHLRVVGGEPERGRALIADPLLERTEKGVRFVGCLARPPTFEPWRTTIFAPATGPAKVLEEMLRAQ